MKKLSNVKRISLVIVAMLLLATVATPAHAANWFSDVPSNHWAASDIQYAANYGIVNGMSDGTFRPDDALTEAQLCQIAYNAFGSGNYGGDKWYSNAVNYVTRSTGITIYPDQIATRQLTCEVVYGLEKNNSRAKNTTPTLDNIVVFNDTANLSLNALRAIWFCRENGIISGFGDGTFRPNDTLTRAQGARIFAAAHQTFGGNNNSSYNNGSNGYYGRNYSGSTAERAFNRARDAARFAADQGLVADVETWDTSLNRDLGTLNMPSSYYASRPSFADRTWSGLFVRSEDGTYTFLTDGDRWYCETSNNRYEEMSEEYLYDWLKSLGSKWSTSRKSDFALDHIIQYCAEIGFATSAESYSRDARYRVEIPAMNNRSQYTPMWVYLDTNGSAIQWYCDGANNVDDLFGLKVWLNDYASTLTFSKKLDLAIAQFKDIASDYGWTVNTSVRNKSGNTVVWYNVTASKGSKSYSFAVGGDDGITVGWRTVKNGTMYYCDYADVVSIF